MCRDQIGPAGLADALLVVLVRDEEEGRQCHHLPGDEEQHRVPGHHDHRHAGDQQIEEEPRRGGRSLATICDHVLGAVHGRERRQPEHRQQEEGGQCVDLLNPGDSVVITSTGGKIQITKLNTPPFTFASACAANSALCSQTTYAEATIPGTPEIDVDFASALCGK